MKTHLAMASASFVLASVVFAEVAPKRITVPAHLEYCVTSQSLDADVYALPEVRNELFDLLYGRIEGAALTAGLPSVGVPFVDEVRSTEAGPITVATGVAAAPGVTYVVRLCVAVPSRGNPPLPADGLREAPERLMYASLCEPAEFEACRREIEQAVRQMNDGTVESLTPIVWRTRPALSKDDTVANFVASLSDAGLRVLRDGAPKRQVPGELAVIAAEIGPVRQ